MLFGFIYLFRNIFSDFGLQPIAKRRSTTTSLASSLHSFYSVFFLQFIQFTKISTSTEPLETVRKAYFHMNKSSWRNVCAASYLSWVFMNNHFFFIFKLMRSLLSVSHSVVEENSGSSSNNDVDNNDDNISNSSSSNSSSNNMNAKKNIQISIIYILDATILFHLSEQMY